MPDLMIMPCPYTCCHTLILMRINWNMQPIKILSLMKVKPIYSLGCFVQQQGSWQVIPTACPVAGSSQLYMNKMIPTPTVLEQVVSFVWSSKHVIVANTVLHRGVSGVAYNIKYWYNIIETNVEHTHYCNDAKIKIIMWMCRFLLSSKCK